VLRVLAAIVARGSLRDRDRDGDGDRGWRIGDRGLTPLDSS
jgi:hypothetical protein